MRETPSPPVTASGTRPIPSGAPGCTVILPPAGHDRGGGRSRRRARAPARRASSRPATSSRRSTALLFTGGSAFGLAAADGVTAWLDGRGTGFAIGPARVPIVAAAVLFDLAVGDPTPFPDEAMGDAACEAARDGRDRDRARSEPEPAPPSASSSASPARRAGGVGAASVASPGRRSVVAALAAVNAFGDVVDPDTGACSPGRPSRPRALSFGDGRCSAGHASPRARSPAAQHDSRLRRDRRAVRPGRPEASRDRSARRHGARRPARRTPWWTATSSSRWRPGAPPRRCSTRLRVGAAAAEAAARAIVAAVRPGDGREARSEASSSSLGAALLWSTAASASRRSTKPPLKVAFYRSAVRRGRPAACSSARASGGRVRRFLAALASYAACLITFVVATKWTTAANAIFLQYSGVVWVLLLSPARPQGAAPGARRGRRRRRALRHGALLRRQFEAGRRAETAMAVLSSLLLRGLILSLRRERGRRPRPRSPGETSSPARALFPFVAERPVPLAAVRRAMLGFLGVFQLAGAYALFVAV